MKKEHLIIHLDNKVYNPILIENISVLEDYRSLNSFIQLNLPERFRNLLSEPRQVPGGFQFFSTLDGLISVEQVSDNVRRKGIMEFSFLIHSIRNLAPNVNDNDTDTSDWDQWMGLLSVIFDLRHCRLFISEEGISVVWGLDFGAPQFELAHQDDLLPFIQDPLFSPFKKIEQFKIESELISNVGDNVVIISSPETTTKKNDVIEEIEDQNVVIIPIERPVVQKEELESVPTQPNLRSSANVNLGRNNRWFKRALMSFILICFFLLGIWWLFQKRNSWEHLQGFIPEKNLVYNQPIDSWIPIMDSSSGRTYAKGLLNVVMMEGLLDHKGSKEFLNFLTEFKSYAEINDVEVNFIDTSFFRMQIKMDEIRRASFKEELKKQYPQFKLLVWDEAIFQHSAKTSTNAVRVEDIYNSDSYQTNVYKRIHCQEAWNITTGDPNVSVAIIDNGFDLNHPELSGKAIKPYNVRERSNDVTPLNGQDHGTHVASIALANGENKWGISGVAPRCSFIPVKIGGSGDSFYCSEIIEGILYAVKEGADVINMSLGGTYNIEPNSVNPMNFKTIISNFAVDESIFWDELFKMMDKKNITIVIAAGNEKLPIGIDPFSRSDAAIKVMAMSQIGGVADFSNYVMMNNFGFVIAAPGADIISAIPGNRFESMDGTSMAAPFVSGAVALIKSQFPGISNTLLKQKLSNTSYVEYKSFQIPALNVYNALK